MAAGQNAAVAAEQHLKAQGTATEQGLWQPDHPARGVTTILDADAGSFELLMPDGVTPRKKIALVGFASSTKDMAPFTEPEWAIVGMNQLSRHIPRADAWFEIHKDYLEACVPGTDHEAWLQTCNLPVLMTQRLPQLPTSCAYPVDRLIQKFSLDYFTSTVAYMLAWVVDYIDQRVEAHLKAAPGNGLASAWDVVQLQRSLYRDYSVGVFGIDLIVGEEYDWQRSCAEFWLGQLLARDVTLIIPPQSALLKQRYRYGYFMEPEDLLKDSDLSKRVAALTQEHQKHSEAAVQLVGALRELETIRELRRLRERGGTITL